MCEQSVNVYVATWSYQAQMNNSSIGFRFHYYFSCVSSRTWRGKKQQLEGVDHLIVCWYILWSEYEENLDKEMFLCTEAYFGRMAINYNLSMCSKTNFQKIQFDPWVPVYGVDWSAVLEREVFPKE